MKPAALLIHVNDVDLGLGWYSKAFPSATKFYIESFDLTVLDLGGFYIEIVQSDNKVKSGKSGTVMYWQVTNLNETVERLNSIGAKLYRGVMPIENGMGMCQLEDPFGNLIGFKGNI